MPSLIYSSEYIAHDIADIETEMGMKTKTGIDNANPTPAFYFMLF
jgi:hypothetical protein